MILEEFENAIEELKRADHSIFATLKYTRSRDVVLSVLDRLSTTFTYSVHAGLLYAKDKGSISDVPEDLKSREYLFRQVYPDFTQMMDLYALLRKVLNCPDYDVEQEFRKNLTLIAEVEGCGVRISVEDIERYYAQIREFLNTLKTIFLNEDI